jgi:hypothetical protein
METSASNNRNACGNLAVRVLDDAHMTWIAAEVASEYALRAWFTGPASRRAAAYVEYRAAVDREEEAARDLQRLYELARADRERLVHTL